MFDQQKLKQRGKILLIVFTSFLISRVLSTTIFLANSPRINREFFARIIKSRSEIANKPSPIPAPSAVPYIVKTFSKGVYALEDKKTKERQIVIEKGAAVNIKKVKVTLPDGTVEEFTVFTPKK